MKATDTRTWAKLIDLGTGPAFDTVDFGWFSDSGDWEVESYDNVVATGLGAGTMSFVNNVFLDQPVIGQWFHLMLTMSLVDSTLWLGTWSIYVDGVLTAYQAEGNYPLPVTRVSSYIGGSDWVDQAAAAVYDAVRVYDYAVSADMVQQLAAMYLVNDDSSTGSG